MIVTDAAGKFELPPAGIHPAFCLNWFDIGMQEGFPDADTGLRKKVHQVVGMFELVCLNENGAEIRISEGEFAGKRFLAYKTYTLSLNEKANLSLDLTSWRGREFTPQERAGGFDLDATKRKPCQLNIVHYTNRKGNERAKIDKILPPQRGSQYRPETPEDFVPAWIQKLISGATTATVREGTNLSDDDIPF